MLRIFIFILVLLFFTSCEKWNLDKKTFPNCDPPSGFVSYSVVNLSLLGTITRPNAAVSRVKWNFGDGKTSTDFSPNYTYSKAGTYLVYVYFYNACDESTYFTFTVTVK